jgi:hypothetical protein
VCEACPIAAECSSENTHKEATWEPHGIHVIDSALVLACTPCSPNGTAPCVKGGRRGPAQWIMSGHIDLARHMCHVSWSHVRSDEVPAPQASTRISPVHQPLGVQVADSVSTMPIDPRLSDNAVFYQCVSQTCPKYFINLCLPISSGHQAVAIDHHKDLCHLAALDKCATWPCSGNPVHKFRAMSFGGSASREPRLAQPMEERPD